MPRTQVLSIGLILDKTHRLSDPSLGSLLTAIADEVTSRGREFQLYAPLAKGDPTVCYEKAIHGHQVDGFIVLRTTPDDRRVAYLSQHQFPFVTFGRTSFQTERHTVAEVADCMEPAVAHLAALGHSRIGYLAEPRGYSISEARRRSFLDSMANHGLPVDYRQVVSGGFGEQTAFEAAVRLLDTKIRPSAIVASNDLLALGTIRAAATLGMAVPEDLGIVGFDDVALARSSRPALTTLGYPTGLIGRRLVEQLVNVANNEEGIGPVLIRPHLVVRESTAPWPISAAASLGPESSTRRHASE